MPVPEGKIEVKLEPLGEENQTPSFAALFTNMAVQEPLSCNSDFKDVKIESVMVLEELSKSKPSPSPFCNVHTTIAQETDTTATTAPPEIKIEAADSEIKAKNDDPADPTIQEEGKGCSIGSSTLTAIRPRSKPKGLRVTVVTKIIQKIRCTICKLPVASIPQLLDHLQITHKIKTVGSPTFVNATERDENKEREKVSMLIEAIDKNRSKCKPSSKTSNVTSSSDKHFERGEGLNSDSLNNRVSTSWGGKKKQSLKDRLEQNLRCKQCYADFAVRHRYRYDRHLKWHTNGKVINCSYCDMTFHFQTSLQGHLRGLELEAAATLTSPEPHKCSDCDSSFANRQCLLYHLTVHDGRHRCPICETSFLFSYDLGKHTRDCHSKQPGRVTCSECDIILSSTKSLGSHMTNIHYRVICPLCQGAFTNQLECDQHMTRMHTKTAAGDAKTYTCKLCLQSFSGTAYLTRHYLIFHNKEPSYIASKRIPTTAIRSYACRLCKDKFTGQAYLTRHYRTFHNKEPSYSTSKRIRTTAIRSYACRLCKDKFTGQAYLTRHYRFVHGREPLKAKGTTSKQVSGTSIGKKVKPENSARSSIRERKNYNEETDSEANHLEEQLITRTVKLEFRDVEENNDELNEEPKEDMNESTNSNYCKLCSKRFSNIWNLERHRRRVHRTQNWPRQLTVKKRSSKKRVIKAPPPSSSEESQDDSKSYISPQKSPSIDKVRRLPCPRCPAKFQSQWKLTRHMNSINCPGRPDPQTLKKLKENRAKAASVVARRGRSGARAGNVRVTVCPYCKKRMMTAHSLRYHLVHLHGEKLDEEDPNQFEHVCPYCEDKKSYQHRDSLIRHLKRYHPDKLELIREQEQHQFVCSYCEDKKSYQYQSKDRLLRHLKRYHPDQVELERMKINKSSNGSGTDSSSEAAEAERDQDQEVLRVSKKADEKLRLETSTITSNRKKKQSNVRGFPLLYSTSQNLPKDHNGKLTTCKKEKEDDPCELPGNPNDSIIKAVPWTPLGTEVRVGEEDSKDTNAAPKDGLSIKTEVDEEETKPKRKDISRASSSSGVNLDELSLSVPNRLNGQRKRKQGSRSHPIPELPRMKVTLRALDQREAKVGQLRGDFGPGPGIKDFETRCTSASKSNTTDSSIQIKSSALGKRRSHYSEVLARSKRKMTVSTRNVTKSFTEISNSVVQIHLKPIDQDSYSKSSPGPSEAKINGTDKIGTNKSVSKNSDDSLCSVPKSRNVLAKVLDFGAVGQMKSSISPSSTKAIITGEQSNKSLSSIRSRTIRKLQAVENSRKNSNLRRTRNHPCPKCKKKFSSPLNLSKHIDRICGGVNSGNSKPSFPKDKKEFHNVLSVSKHAERIQICKYNCPKCGKEFGYEGNIPRHLKYYCKGSAKEHINNVPNDIEKKDFLAAGDKVGRKSARVVDLTKKKLEVDADNDDCELLAVYDFDCTTCGESFDVESDLRKHVKRHHPK